MRDLAERDRLVLAYRPAARLVALQAKRRMPRWIDLEDLEQWAYLGLIKAAELYDERAEAPFPAFAWRIMQRRVWDQYRRKKFHEEMVARLPLHSAASCCERPTVEQDIDRERKRQAVRAALAKLSDRDQTILYLYYSEDLYLKLIGRRLGVNESRACQLRKRALARARCALEAAGYSPSA